MSQSIKVCGRCHAMSKSTHRRCKLKTCWTLPYCHVHNPGITGLAVKTSRLPGAGRGLFAAKKFTRPDVITSYNGERMTKAQLDAIYGKGQSNYGLQIGANLYVDARRTDSGLGRYANSCNAPRGQKAPCKNNARLVVNMKKHTASLQACTTINPGSEIYTSYGPDYRINGKKLVEERSLCRRELWDARKIRRSGPSGESKKRKAARLAREAAAAAALAAGLPPPPARGRKKAAKVPVAAKKAASKRALKMVTKKERR